MPECRIVTSLAEINAENWRSLDTNNNPFYHMISVWTREIQLP